LFCQPVEESYLSGYEIHIGQTIYQAGAKHLADVSSRDAVSESKAISEDGCISADSRVFGTYLHGLFDDDRFRHQFICAARAFHKLAAPVELMLWKQLREESLDRLALEVGKSLDMRTIFSWVGLTYENVASAASSNNRSQKEEAPR
jgi:adenosylcobyric acid synthase